MRTKQAVLRDHRFGAGRIDPARLRRALDSRRGHASTGLLGMLQTILLAVLLLAAWRDISPVEATRLLLLDGEYAVLRLLLGFFAAGG